MKTVFFFREKSCFKKPEVWDTTISGFPDQ